MMSLLKHIAKKIFKMEEVKESMEEKTYVWIRSERAGDVVVTDSSKKDKTWVYFTDGTRINKKLISEYLMESSDEDSALKMSESFKGVEEKIQKVETTEIHNTTKQIHTEPEPMPIDDNSVMVGMLKKMSKKNKAEMTVNIHLPSKAVYSMLLDEMDLDQEEINQYISRLIESQIDNLRDQLRGQIQTFIKTYYND